MHTQTRCWPGEVFPTYSTLDKGGCCHRVCPLRKSKEQQQLSATGLCEHSFLQAFSHDEHTTSHMTSVQRHSHDEPAQTHQDNLTDENPLNSPGCDSFISRGLGSLSPRMNLQELPGFPEALPSFQDKGYNILTGKLTEEISANSLNWMGFFWLLLLFYRQYRTTNISLSIY